MGEAAAALVEDAMTVGLGTGSTAACMVQALGARASRERLTLACVATSEATARLAAAAGLRLVELDDAGEIDLTLDGADEIGPDLALIKGAGGALLREKLVWEASRRCIVIADQTKRVERLGRFPLPVEVVAFGHAATARRLTGALADGAPGRAVLRRRDGEIVRTDGGNLIYDLFDACIDDPPGLATRLKALTGVVEHGLFLGLADMALIAGDHGVLRLDRNGRSSP